MTDGTTAGSVQVSIERADGALITSANYRWGKDIGIRLEAGTQAGYVKAVISLSDGTELVSNEYKIVEVLESDVYVTAITLVPDMTAGTIGGNISYSNGTTQTINSVSVPTAPGVTSAIEALQGRMAAVEQKNTAQDASISSLNSRVQAIEDTPGVGQFAAGKLGTIAGSTTDGRIKAEDDGTGSVNGWSALKQRVSTAEGQIVTAQNDISNLTNNKVNISQGANNAGKVLGIGTDGNVTPIEVSTGEKWEEVDLSNFPTDWTSADKVRFNLKIVSGNSRTPSSWTDSNIEATFKSYNEAQSNIIELDFSVFNGNILINITESSNYINVMTLDNLTNLYTWNSKGRLFTLKSISFNGGAKSSKSEDVNPRSGHIYKMWRLKK